MSSPVLVVADTSGRRASECSAAAWSGREDRRVASLERVQRDALPGFRGILLGMPAGVLEFELADQLAFARLSGDFNPIHVDPGVARRELFGEVVVHGVHVLLHALEHVLESVRPAGLLRVDSLVCRFKSPVLLGREHHVRILGATDSIGATDAIGANGATKANGATGANDAAGGTGSGARVEVRTNDGILAVEATVRWSAAERGRSAEVGDGALYEPVPPADRSLAELRDLSGEIGLGFDRAALAARFPVLARHVDAVDLAQVLALTRIVGMECPGLRSVFVEFEVARQDVAPTLPTTAGPRIAFRAEEVDDRLPRVLFTVRGPSLAGRVTTFRRPRAEVQPSVEEVAERVPAGIHAGVRAVIVGGSRGIGEVTAKIIAAGGGRPILSYRAGRGDAERVAEEIRRRDLSCEIFEFDVLAPAVVCQEPPFVDIGSLYYFASPRISRRQGHFDGQVFGRYCDFYVRGFLDTVRLFGDCAPARSRLRVFYPSSTMVVDHDAGFMEYAAAKQAGESACGYLARHSKAVSVHVERLPKLATDQTLSLIPSRRVPVLDAMIGVVGAVESMGSPAAT